MNKIINDHFKEGQRYIGMVNGAELTAEKIQEAGTYETPHGGIYTVEQTRIHFRDEKTGAIYERNIETAKRLLLRLVEN